jgi:crossover junction endodeoxyribonuclease RuvC
MATIILGVDPGLVKTGWGVIEQAGSSLKFLGNGVIAPNTKIPIEKRLHTLHNELSKVVLNFLPDECAIEETFVNKNASSSLKLGFARGALLLSLSINKLPLSEYAPNLIKKTVVGVGRAEKGQIQAMVKILLPSANVDSEDATDALAIAICHASHRSLPGGISG